MHLFSNISVKAKLLIIIISTSSIALILACIAFTTFDWISTKQAMVGKLRVMASLVGDNSISALAFGDPQNAIETLNALEAEGHIVAASIYDAHGEVFARYHREDRDFVPPAPSANNHYFTADYLEVFHAVVYDGEHLGVVYIQSDLLQLQARLKRYIGIGILFVLAAAVAAAVIAVLLQRLVSNPITALAAMARTVSTDHNYTVRAPERGAGDELGDLTAYFNQMLERVQIRDAELEARVRQRTAELLKAKENAEASNRDKSTFLIRLSHELRTSINSITGMAELALDDDAASAQHGYMKIVLEAANNLLNLFNDLLDLSRIETGQVELEQVPFSLRETLDGAIQELEREAHTKGIALKSHLSPDLPDALLGDPDRLLQIVVTLVRNGIQSTPFGSVALELEVEEEGPNYLRLRGLVQDTGMGVAADRRGLIFNPFAQDDTTTVQPYGSTGLGLAICKYLVEMMDGSIWLENQEGHGSTFHFSIRVGLSREPIKKSAPAESTASFQHIPDLLHILLVEDTLVNQRSTMAMLEKSGHTATATNSGREALATLEQDSFDVVLMDVQMPEMSGLEATERIRAREQRSGGHIPIIALTAFAMEGDKERCLTAGMDGYLAKPFRFHQLVEEIARVLHGSSQLETRVESALTGATQPDKKTDFVKTYPAYLEKMWIAVAAKDGEGLAIAAHDLKGMLENIGDNAGHQTAQHLEQLAREGTLERAAEVCAGLENRIKDIVTQLPRGAG